MSKRRKRREKQKRRSKLLLERFFRENRAPRALAFRVYEDEE